MIDVFDEKQVREILESRKQEFEYNNRFFVLTPLNHAFYFWDDGNVNICDSSNSYLSFSYQPEIARLYGVKYDSKSTFISNPKTCEHLYELFISDPECMFFHNWNELEQEFRHRGLR